MSRWALCSECRARNARNTPAHEHALAFVTRFFGEANGYEVQHEGVVLRGVVAYAAPHALAVSSYRAVLRKPVVQITQPGAPHVFTRQRHYFFDVLVGNPDC
eukprot:TRINITY_DN526_c0_g1_i1.p3 TRINITY_DN526_c0_g1~~TRINITY_DN526_c0_g1_i1.p3  ORF type:complete len:102 (+),score=6.45 TRINITY_DN526_c0_g1_i1:418-723(+)